MHLFFRLVRLSFLVILLTGCNSFFSSTISVGKIIAGIPCHLNTSAFNLSSIKLNFNFTSATKRVQLFRDGTEIFSNTNPSVKSFIDTGLNEGRPYRYSCTTTTKENIKTEEHVSSNSYTVTTSPPTFAGITNAVGISFSSVKSFWGSPVAGSFASKYQIFVSPGSVIDFNLSPVATISYLNNVGWSVLNGLTPGAEYTFAVRACTWNNLCDSNSATITKAMDGDSVAPVIAPPVVSVLRDALSLSQAGITISSPGRVWELSVTVTDNRSGVASIKVYRKRTNNSSDFSDGDEDECEDDLDNNCLIADTNSAAVTVKEKTINNSSPNFYHNYLIVAEDGFGNSTSDTIAVKGHYPIQVAAGDQHTCALFNHWGVSCWGRGAEGQLGYSGLSNQNADTAGFVDVIDPILDAGATHVIKLAAKSNRSCAVLNNKRIKCWGQGRYLEPSRGAHWGVYVATIGSHNIPWINYYDQFTYDSTLDANSYFSYLLDSNLTPRSIASYELHVGEEIDQFDISDNIQCASIAQNSATINAGKMKCWGKPVYSSRFWSASQTNTRHGHHQTSCLLGNDLNDTPAAPKTSDTQWQVLNWLGYINENWNRCANGFREPASNDFVNTTGFETEVLVDFSVGNRHVCAVYENISAEKHVRCWGGAHNNSHLTESNYNNLLGVGGRWYGLGKPVAGLFVPILSEDPLNVGQYLKDDILDIVNSSMGSCVLLAPTENSLESRNKIRCWGNNESGQYGIGNSVSIVMSKAIYSTTDNSAPTVASALSFNPEINPQKLFAFKNGNSYCTIDDLNKVYCWGLNSIDGELGTGGTTNIGDNEAITSAVATSTRVITMDMGKNHICTILLSGEIQCWGNNASEQLGVSGASLLSPSDASIPALY